MKKLIFACCVAALFVACKSTTNASTTGTTQTETTTTTTKTETTKPEKPEEAAHNYYMLRGTGSHYTSGNTVYNEFLVEMYPDILEIFRVSDTVITNTDYMITFDDNGTTVDYTDDKIITFKEV